MHNLVYSFIGLFVAMDVIGTLPMYLGIVRGIEAGRRRYIVRQSVFVAAAVAMIFAMLGQWIFRVLGIALCDFQVGGGIVLLIIAILDLVGRKTEDSRSASTGVVPLAVPLITGPAVIMTVMLQVGLYGNLVVLLSMAANFLFAWIVLSRSGLITRLIGDEGTDIVSKIAALLMTAIAFSMIRRGIFDAIRLFPTH